MKKKLVILMLSAMMAAAGCGNSNTNQDVQGTETAEATESAAGEYESPSYDLNAADYVTLCDYEKIPVTITGDYEVDDEDVTSFFEQWFTYSGPFYRTDETKTTVGEGDIVNVDYVGKLDGEAFDGGSAENQNIDVDNNSSGNSDLAGKDVVFTFTVNSIQKEMGIDDVDDAFAKEQFNVDTVDDMYAQLRSYLESSAESSRESDTYTAIQDYLLANCQVDIPEDYLTARVNDYEKQFVQNYCGGDVEKLPEYLDTNYGKTAEEARAEWTEGMEQNISIELITAAIADAEGIELDEEGYEAYIQNLVSNNGYESEEALYQAYGYDDAAYGEKYLRQIYVDNLALQQLRDSAEVTVEALTETEGTESTEDLGTETVESTENQ